MQCLCNVFLLLSLMLKFATVEKSQRYFTTIDKFIYLTMLRMIDWMMMLIDDVDD